MYAAGTLQSPHFGIIKTYSSLLYKPEVEKAKMIYGDMRGGVRDAVLKPEQRFARL